MNTAIHDGYDLGWKLGWVLRGWARRRCSTPTSPSGGRSPSTTCRGRPTRPARARNAAGRGPRRPRRPHPPRPGSAGRRAGLDARPARPRLTLFTARTSEPVHAPAAAGAPVAVRRLDLVAARALGVPGGGALMVRPDGYPQRELTAVAADRAGAVADRSNPAGMGARLRARLTYANAMSTIALFVALGGVSYAATLLPPGSVGTKQIRGRAVTGRKVATSTLGMRVVSQQTRTALGAIRVRYAAAATESGSPRTLFRLGGVRWKRPAGRRHRGRRPTWSSTPRQRRRRRSTTPSATTRAPTRTRREPSRPAPCGSISRRGCERSSGGQAPIPATTSGMRPLRSSRAGRTPSSRPSSRSPTAPPAAARPTAPPTSPTSSPASCLRLGFGLPFGLRRALAARLRRPDDFSDACSADIRSGAPRAPPARAG